MFAVVDNENDVSRVEDDGRGNLVGMKDRNPVIPTSWLCTDGVYRDPHAHVCWRIITDNNYSPPKY